MVESRRLELFAELPAYYREAATPELGELLAIASEALNESSLTIERDLDRLCGRRDERCDDSEGVVERLIERWLLGAPEEEGDAEWGRRGTSAGRHGRGSKCASLWTLADLVTELRRLGETSNRPDPMPWVGTRAVPRSGTRFVLEPARTRGAVCLVWQPEGWREEWAEEPDLDPSRFAPGLEISALLLEESVGEQVEVLCRLPLHGLTIEARRLWSLVVP